MTYLTNRAAFIVIPRQPFVDWVQGLDADAANIPAEDIMDPRAVYLVFDHEDGYDQEKLIQNNFKAVFEEQLNGWSLDETQWPEKRDLRTFKKWFHIAICSMVIDLADKQPMIESDY